MLCCRLVVVVYGEGDGWCGLRAGVCLYWWSAAARVAGLLWQAAVAVVWLVCDVVVFAVACVAGGGDEDGVMVRRARKKVTRAKGVGWLCARGEVLVPSPGRWKAVQLDGSDLPEAMQVVGPVYRIYERVRKVWRAKLLVARSALLDKAGARKRGFGLWPLVPLRGPVRAKGLKGANVGSYGGLIVARGPTAAAARRAATPLARAGRRHLLCLHRGGEWVVVDGAAQLVLPMLAAANDPRGTGCTASCLMSAAGVMTMRRGVLAVDPTRPLSEQYDLELSFSYGAEYWRVHV